MKTLQDFFQLRWLSADIICYLAANLQKAYSLDLEDFSDGKILFSGRLSQMDENLSTPVKLLWKI